VVMQDIRHAFRLFLRTPIVTATALLTIALGVGGSAAVFGVVYAVMLRPLPYPHPERLVELFESDRRGNASMMRASALNYQSWAERATSLEAVAAFQSSGFTLTELGEPERLDGSVITASMFDVLGLPPLAGRGFRVEDERPGANRVAVLAEPLWRRRFGANPAIVGQSITLNDERYEIIGVMPSAFREAGRARMTATEGPQIFVPLVIDPARENRGNHIYRVVGRLRDGVSLDRARDEMSRIAAAMEQEFPASNKDWGVRIETLYTTMLDERVRPSLLVLLAAVGMVLLIACANVANVLLARGIARQRELAIRTALGAGRSRLFRQLVTESVCLAVVSGACGLAVAVVAVEALRAMLPATLPRVDEIRVDAPVLAAGVLLSLASGIFMGLAPALRASRAALVPALVSQGKGLAGTSRTFLRQAIVVAQMALATMLLVGAALLLQSFVRLQHVPLGFEPEGIVTARISLPQPKYSDAARVWAFYEQLIASLDGLPQVQAVGGGTSAPFTPGVRASGKARHRAQAASASDNAWIGAAEHLVSPDYFRTLGVPLTAGRPFGRQDSLTSPPVAIVSESAARQLWPGENPIGRTFEWNGRQTYEVIGVVRDIRGSAGGGADREPGAAVYLSVTQSPQRSMTLMVRTSGDPSAVVPAIARAVQDLDPAQPLYQVRRMSDWIDESASQPRATTALSGVFALVALLLAAVGVYGVLSYSVTQRTQEIGVRMAIGARRGQIVALVLRNGLTWALAGIAIGLIGAVQMSSVIATLLFEVKPGDPITYLGAGVMLAAVATIACCIPAIRATRIDPLIALRSE
jgi:putative ABC transport system permease protein